MFFMACRATAIRQRRPRFESLESRRLLTFDPSPLEQELFMYVNRLRTDPQAEYDALIASTQPLAAHDPEVDFALRYFNVDGDLLRSQWNSLAPVAPVAWHASLYEAAHFHNQAMIAAQTQAHVLPGGPNPGQRIQNAGYNWNTYAENIFAYAKSPLYAHAGFAIDWGFGPGGIQSPPGHRQAIMGGAYREVGIALTETGSQSFGPQVVTQNFASRSNIGNPYVLGAVWNDLNDDGWYSAGEGLGGVRIEFARPGNPTVVVHAMSAGGYQAQLAAGTWHATAFVDSLGIEIASGPIVVGAHNVMMNFIVPDGAPPVALDDFAATLRNTPVTIDVRANDFDPDGDLAAAVVEVLSAPPGSQATVDPATGWLTFTPIADFHGEAVVWYRLRDPQGFRSQPAKVTIAVAHETRPRQNPIEPFDVNHDGLVTPLDALLIINALNAGEPLSGVDTPPPGMALLPFLDSSGDNLLTPLDAVLIVNYLNAGQVAAGEAPGGDEGGGAPVTPAFASVSESTAVEAFYSWWLWQALDDDRLAAER
jgi:hypothetical protein